MQDSKVWPTWALQTSFSWHDKEYKTTQEQTWYGRPQNPVSSFATFAENNRGFLSKSCANKTACDLATYPTPSPCTLLTRIAFLSYLFEGSLTNTTFCKETVQWGSERRVSPIFNLNPMSWVMSANKIPSLAAMQFCINSNNQMFWLAKICKASWWRISAWHREIDEACRGSLLHQCEYATGHRISKTCRRQRMVYSW